MQTVEVIQVGTGRVMRRALPVDRTLVVMSEQQRKIYTCTSIWEKYSTSTANS